MENSSKMLSFYYNLTLPPRSRNETEDEEYNFCWYLRATGYSLNSP